MGNLLPIVTQPANPRLLRSHPLASWLPAIRAIADRHELTVGEVTRFPGGDYPVFASGNAWVLKLVPPGSSEVLAREIALQRSLPADVVLPVPTMLGQGTLEDWHYLLSTRVPGLPLHQVWPTLNRPQQEALAEDFGRMLGRLHALEITDPQMKEFPNWDSFVRQSAARWSTRWGIERVPRELQHDGPRFLAAAGFHEFTSLPSAWRRLHGDLAPENALAHEAGGAWRVSGIIDFGNARVGDPLFDYTAPTVLLQPGDAAILRRFLGGAGLSAAIPWGALRTRLMAYTLIHPMADLRACLDLIPGAAACATWDDVAGMFWPVDG